MIDLIKLSQDPSLESWRKVFDESTSELEDIQHKISKEIKKGKTIVPEQENIFRAFVLTPLDQVKVVIIGQDPYIDTVEGNIRATGLSFSNNPKIQNFPPSLKNILNRVHDNYPNCNVENSTGDLTSWALQGVLMLNMSLTTNLGTSDAHGGIWKGLISRVITAIEEQNPNCIYVLWGLKAIELETKMYLRGIIFKSTHPSGRSASKSSKDIIAFNDNKHFLQINRELKRLKKEQINWCL